MRSTLDMMSEAPSFAFDSFRDGINVHVHYTERESLCDAAPCTHLISPSIF